MDRTAQLLFNYLRDILYHPEKAALNLNDLPEDFRMLGEGMQFLAKCVKEEKAFAQALARGDLSQKPPDGNNVLAAPIKAIHGALLHLAWQTKQVAKGDYRQHVDFMGEFADAFNSMTRQLRDRTASLQAEKEVVEQKNLELHQTLELVLALTNYTHNMIFVFSESTGERIFANHTADWLLKNAPAVATSLQGKLIGHAETLEEDFKRWETEADFGGRKGKCYYNVESFHITWTGERAVVHILMDDTERKNREDLMHRLAYVDPLTGLNNRRYALDLMENWSKEGVEFLLSFIDVDYLKYCNDTFGHNLGDQYLMNVAGLLKTLGGELCRVGGDEFILIQKGNDIEWQDKRLEECRYRLENRRKAPYPQSFSYATTLVPVPLVQPLKEYINETDVKMYKYKQEHKKPLNADYNDDRI